MIIQADIERDLIAANRELAAARAMFEHSPNAGTEHLVASHEMAVNILLDALPREHENREESHA